MGKEQPASGGVRDAIKKKGFNVSVDSDMIRTAKSVAKKVFKRKKKKRDLSSPRG